MEGADGADLGVAAAELADHDPVPTAFTAATRNTYATPLVRPVTVAETAVDVPSVKSDQVTPAFEEYWST